MLKVHTYNNLKKSKLNEKQCNIQLHCLHLRFTILFKVTTDYQSSLQTTTAGNWHADASRKSYNDIPTTKTTIATKNANVPTTKNKRISTTKASVLTTISTSHKSMPTKIRMTLCTTKHEGVHTSMYMNASIAKHMSVSEDQFLGLSKYEYIGIGVGVVLFIAIMLIAIVVQLRRNAR